MRAAGQGFPTVPLDGFEAPVRWARGERRVAIVTGAM